MPVLVPGGDSVKLSACRASTALSYSARAVKAPASKGYWRAMTTFMSLALFTKRPFQIIPGISLCCVIGRGCWRAVIAPKQCPNEKESGLISRAVSLGRRERGQPVSFSVEWDFARHIFPCMPNVRVVTCPQCGAKFGTAKSLDSHRCPECFARFSDESGPKVPGVLIIASAALIVLVFVFLVVWTWP